MYEQFFILILRIKMAQADIIPDPNTRITQQLPGSSLSDTFSIFEKSITGIVFQVLSAIAVIMVIVTGYRYITSAGDPEKAKKARQAFIQVLAGFVLFILVYFVVNFIVNAVNLAGAGA